DKHPDINFIHACSTDIAFGALDALKKRKLLGKILVNGWGGGANELKSLLSKELDFTVMRMNDDNGVAMAEAIRLDIELKLKTKPIFFSGKMVIVRQGILENDILKLKNKAFRYSGWQ
ncbi:MAG: sugar ABC transporter substrate-binding protein, partial [archaeon]|nr:sugar ABC transporter substrate-binding protein [archaeon]